MTDAIEESEQVVPIEEDARIGCRLGNLEIVDRIGIGGMGAVYRAVHKVLETPYAVKVLHPRFSEDPDAVERFRAEAIATSRLRHPNVVFVTDFGFDSSVGLYLVMEHLGGATLRDLIHRNGALTVGRMVHIGDQLCAAMAAAHRLEIVHRDLKPENVIVLSDLSHQEHIKVLDFGIARLRDAAEEASEEILGTPQYMAPEQIAGNELAALPTVDIYALGMVFHAMLTGQPAFVGDDHAAVLKAQLQQQPAPVSLSNPMLADSALEQLVLDMLAKQPERRPQNLTLVRQRLAEAIEELVEAGVAGSTYEPPALEADASGGGDATAVWTGAVSGTIRMTAVIKQIRTVGPRSAAAVLLDAMPALETVRGETICLALWGILQQELLEHEPGSADFTLTTDQLVLLMQAILESHDGTEPSNAQLKMFRAIRITLPIIGADRRTAVLAALRPLSTSPLFPDDFIEQEHGGSWETVKRIMTAEIHLPWRRTGPDASPKPKVRKSAKVEPSQEELAKMSLLQKLQQDVSVRSIGAVLSHEIRIFPRNETKQLAGPVDVAGATGVGMAPASEGVASEWSEGIEDAEEVALSGEVAETEADAVPGAVAAPADTDAAEAPVELVADSAPVEVSDEDIEDMPTA